MSGQSVETFQLALSVEKPLGGFPVADLEARVLSALSGCKRLLRWAVVSAEKENSGCRLSVEGAYLKC